jgi:hypothetical protein
VNEDIAQMLLAMEARITQQNQRLADLEFQLRQAHRDLVRVQQMVGESRPSMAPPPDPVVHYQGGTAWPGRTRLS